MSHLKTKERTKKDNETEHPNGKSEANKSPTVRDSGSQPIAIDIDLDSTIVSLTNMLNYFLRLKEKRIADLQSTVQQASPTKEDISGGEGSYSGSTKSPQKVIFANESSGNIPSCSNFRDSIPRCTAMGSALTSHQNVTTPQKNCPIPGACSYDPSSPVDSAKTEASSSNQGKKFSRNNRKRKNNRNNTYVKETESNFNFKGTSQNKCLSNESQKNSPVAYKNMHTGVYPRLETTAHGGGGNDEQSGNQMALALVKPDIPTDSVQISQNSSVSGASFSDKRNDETSSISCDKNSALVTNEPIRDNADMAVDTVSQIPSSTVAETLSPWDPPSTEIAFYDSRNMLNPERQHFQPIRRWHSDRATPRYSNQHMPSLNWASLALNRLQSSYLNNYHTSTPTNMQSNIYVASNVVQEHRSLYGNSYEAMYNSVSTNLYLNSVWSPPPENSHIFNDTYPPYTPPLNSSPWYPYPYSYW